MLNETQKGKDKSYVLVHIQTLDADRIGEMVRTREVCGSDYISELLSLKVEELFDDEQISLYFKLEGGDDRAASMRGQLFQPIVRRALCKPWDEETKQQSTSFLGNTGVNGSKRVDKKSSNAPPKILTLNGMELSRCSSSDQVREALQNGGPRTLVESLNKSFAIGDFLGISPSGAGTDYDVFQVTVSNKHRPTANGLEMLSAYLPPTDRSLRNNGVLKIRLFFCVPPSRFHPPGSTLPPTNHQIGFQCICKSNADKNLGKCPAWLELRQFALEVDPSLHRPKRRATATEDQIGATATKHQREATTTGQAPSTNRRKKSKGESNT